MNNYLYSQLIHPNLDNKETFLLLDDGKAFSYEEIISIASKISHKLIKLGLKVGDPLLVKAPKCKETIALYLSSIMTGAVYFPLNSNYTPIETNYFVKDSKPAFLICEESEIKNLKPICDEVGCKILSMSANGEGEITDGLKNFDNYFKPAFRKDEDLAALLYTSGTTGKPKAAMLTQQNLVSNAIQLVNLWNINRDDTLIHSLPIYHTHGLFVAMNTTMMAGATVRLLKNFNLDYVFQAFDKSTLMMGVPTFYTRLLKDKRLNKKHTKNMRLFISGSAPLLKETHKNFYDITGHHILERYGMTETNMNSSNPLDGVRKAGSVGKPIKDINIRISATEGSEVLNKNQIGMIEIKGPNVFKGYLNKLDQTKEAFTKDGYFITGDIGYFDDDGYLYISGRNKDLIISGGYNVYPKEIEDVINEYENVIESAVFGIPDNDLGEIPVAAIVMYQKDIKLENIKSYLEKNLVRYKIPKEYFVLDELPKNIMGKVQKNILKEKYNKN